MTLLYFEGFDLHTRVLNSLDPGAGAAQDAGYYWRGGTITRYDFPTGYNSGNAMNVTSGGTNNAGSVSLGGYVGRIGFWGKIDSDHSVAFVSIGRPGLNINFTHAGFGQMAITHNISGTLGVSASGVIDDEWAYYEIFCNAPAGVYQFSRNGVLQVNVFGGPVTNSGFEFGVTLGTPSLSTAPDLLIDHLWITDGAFPAGTDVLGVQVAAAIDKYDSAIDAFVGSIIIDGDRYVTPMAAAVVSSQASYAAGENLANVVNFKFNNDPSTGSPWTRASYETIEKWGLCYVERGSPPGTMRVISMVLATLEYNDGEPLVVNRAVDGAGEFSGPWVRSDPTKSFSWHLQNVPRETVILEANARALYIDGEGCALFRGPAEAANPVAPVFQEIGVTFAEEFREDYTDWVRIDGVGSNFDSYFVSGYGIYGDGNRKFQSNYVTVNFENVPTGGAYIQGLWDYTIDPDTGRWSMNQNIYKDTDGYKHGTRRLKIRGHGKTLQLRVSSKDGKPFKINGWTILVTSNTNV